MVSLARGSTLPELVPPAAAPTLALVDLYEIKVPHELAPQAAVEPPLRLDKSSAIFAKAGISFQEYWAKP